MLSDIDLVLNRLFPDIRGRAARLLCRMSGSARSGHLS